MYVCIKRARERRQTCTQVCVYTHMRVHTHTHTHTLRVIDLQTNFYNIGASEDGSIKKHVLKLLKASFV